MTQPPNPLFANFQPVQPEASQSGLGEALAQGMEQKTPRKKREPKEPKAAKARKATTVRVKPKATTVETAAPKFELRAILAATKGLQDADMPLFEKLVGLDTAARNRVLAAIGKIFA